MPNDIMVSSVTVDGDFGVEVVGKSEALGIWLKFAITVREEAPHYWAGVSVQPTTPP